MKSPWVLAIVRTREAGVLRGVAERLGMAIEVVDDVQHGVSRLADGPWCASVLSLSLPGAGREAVERMMRSGSAGALLVGSRNASLDLTLAIRRAGGTLFREPLDPADVAAELAAAAREQDTDPGIPLPDVAPNPAGKAPALVGCGPSMTEVFRLVAQISESATPVLLVGEPGTGKARIARAIHDASPRHASPFIAVNCGAIPEHLLEAELFGHAAWPDDGCRTARMGSSPVSGRIERASGGTLFLNEIEDLSPVLRSRLLRVLETGAIESMDGGSPVPVDVRIVAAATGSSLAEGGSGTPGADFFRRMDAFRLDLPPLRERQEDLEALALHFAARSTVCQGQSVRFLGRDALERLRMHPWPGNLRELRNVMDRAVLRARGSVIMPIDFELGEREGDGSSVVPGALDGAGGAGGPGGAESGTELVTLAEAEADHIARVLRLTGGHMGETAELLGIHRNTLTRKVREYDLGEDASR